MPVISGPDSEDYKPSPVSSSINSTTAVTTTSETTGATTATRTSNNNDNSNINNNCNPENVIECAACGFIIQDKYYLDADDKKWHIKCLQCCQCKTLLEKQSKCYFRDGQIYCSDCRIFPLKRCHGCGQVIYPKDLCMKALENVYHIHCFTCFVCNTPLTQGDHFGIRNNLVYCRIHFEMYPSMIPLSGIGGGLSGCGSGGSLGGPGAGLGTGLSGGGGVGYLNDYFLSSENAIHPLGDHYPPPHDPVTGLPAYGSIYGSPGNSIIGSSSMSRNGLSPGVNGGTGGGCGGSSAGVVPGAPGGGCGGGGGITSGTPAGVTGTGVRKGRPRKRKTTVNGGGCGGGGGGPDAQTPSNCSSIHDQANGDGNSGPNSNALSVPTSCSLDVLSGSMHDSAGVLSGGGGQGLSCHGLGGGGQRTKRMRTSFKHHQLRAMKSYFSLNQNPDAKDLKNLALKTGLTKRVLQVWFQNARAKWRRNNIKEHGGSGSQDGQGQTQQLMGSNSILNPESPSTGIGSPGGSSTRPFSTPSPSMNTMIPDSGGLLHNGGSNGSSLDQFPQISSSTQCSGLGKSSPSPSTLPPPSAPQPSGGPPPPPPPPPQLSTGGLHNQTHSLHLHHPHPHHLHPHSPLHNHHHHHHHHHHQQHTSLHPSSGGGGGGIGGDSIIPALTSFQELF